ncbi:hypothetical protein MMC30_007892 [Trapelia coarctata]|nr:hypothetical protein [Trapelia coarctata]
MKVIRLSDNTATPTTPYSATNPAPPSAIILDENAPIPQIARPNQLLVRVHAAVVVRDELIWPETYRQERAILGYDFAGTVVSVYSPVENSEQNSASEFKPGDEVYGMVDTAKGSTWAEYVLAETREVAIKPKRLGWGEAAVVPMSALTAWQALFEVSGVPPPNFQEAASHKESSGTKKTEGKKALITGAAGNVGSWLVQLASLAQLHVTAATSSNTRNESFLQSLGADNAVEYASIDTVPTYNLVVDTVGGTTLGNCWSLVKDGGTLVSVDSGSFDFVNRHRRQQVAKGKDNVKAIFFIVAPSGEQLKQIAVGLELNLLQTFVSQYFPLEDAAKAYEIGNGKSTGRGKIVLTV